MSIRVPTLRQTEYSSFGYVYSYADFPTAFSSLSATGTLAAIAYAIGRLVSFRPVAKRHP